MRLVDSFMGGINFWGGTKEDDIFLAPSFDDKILEVVAVFGSVQMAASRLLNLQHHRIAQCQSIQINILGILAKRIPKTLFKTILKSFFLSFPNKIIYFSNCGIFEMTCRQYSSTCMLKCGCVKEG